MENVLRRRARRDREEDSRRTRRQTRGGHRHHGIRVSALEHFAIYLTRKGFPNRGCFDSTFWLGGGQRGWVDHILKICVIG